MSGVNVILNGGFLAANFTTFQGSGAFVTYNDGFGTSGSFFVLGYSAALASPDDFIFA